MGGWTLSVRGGYSGFPVLKDKTRETQALATQAFWLCWYTKWKDLNITDPKLCPHPDWGCPRSPDTSMLTPSHVGLTCQAWPFLSFSGPPWLETQGFHWGHQSLDGISWSLVNTVVVCLQLKAFKSARGFTKKPTFGFENGIIKGAFEILASGCCRAGLFTSWEAAASTRRGGEAAETSGKMWFPTTQRPFGS